jgi:hypothetical protein
MITFKLTQIRRTIATAMMVALISGTLAGTVSPLSAQDAPAIDPNTGLAVPPVPAANFVPGRMIGMRPEEKRPLVLKENERNPYAKRSTEEETAGDEAVNEEEQQIRARLSSLTVSGRSQGPNGLRVLLGDIILEQGRLLPQLLETQSENLKVMEINEDTVILGWLDIESNEPTGKTMQVAYDLTPMVSYALHGQESPEADANGEVAAPLMGVLRIGQDRKTSESRMAISKKSTEIPREVFEAGQ